MNGHSYVPILKWKKGEMEALKNLSPTQKSSIIPILEIVEYDDPKLVIKDIQSSYHYPVYVDCAYIDNEDGDYIKSLVGEGTSKSLEIYPILRFDDFPELAHDFLQLTKRLAVRIPLPEDIESESYSTIFKTLSKWATENNPDIHFDIVLDANLISDKAKANFIYAEIKNVLGQHIGSESIFDRIIIAMTSFPDDLSSIVAGESIFIDRYEVKIFKKVFLDPQFENIRKHLIFSDYGVTRFTDSEIDFSKLQYGILPKAKYTISNYYWVLKGKRNTQTKQWIKNHTALAKEISSSKNFYKENFSFGDFEIKQRAEGKLGPGNNTNWVTIAANHHIAVVLEELSTIHDS